tara:strand:- start:731 stop:1102 length:372 start_codon:yes stop_codon:yes gene_type:complete
MSCEFCQKSILKRIIVSSKSIIAIYDQNPVSKYHAIIIPKRHFRSFFEIKKDELIEVFEILKKLKKIILKKDKSIKGFNFGVNLGKLAGQIINHCHFHLIPRRINDYDLRLKKKKTNKFFWIK